MKVKVEMSISLWLQHQNVRFDLQSYKSRQSCRRSHLSPVADFQFDTRYCRRIRLSSFTSVSLLFFLFFLNSYFLSFSILSHFKLCRSPFFHYFSAFINFTFFFSAEFSSFIHFLSLNFPKS